MDRREVLPCVALPQTGPIGHRASHGNCCFILSQSQVRCQRNARVPLKAHQTEGHKALRVTERQRPTEEMRDTPLLPRFSHHLPTSPRTPPRAQRRTEAERRPNTRSQSRTASEECSSPLCRGSVDREDDEVTARRPRPNLRRACACVHRRHGGVGSPRALRTESTPSSDCPRFRAVPPVGETAFSPRSRESGPALVKQ